MTEFELLVDFHINAYRQGSGSHYDTSLKIDISNTRKCEMYAMLCVLSHSNQNKVRHDKSISKGKVHQYSILVLECNYCMTSFNQDFGILYTKTLSRFVTIP